MKKLVVLAAALALVPTLAPAKAQARTEAQQNAAIAKLTAKMNCLKRFPLVSFGDYAAYSNQTVDNDLLTWDDSLGSGNPDELQDAGVVSGSTSPSAPPSRPMSGPSGSETRRRAERNSDCLRIRSLDRSRA